MVAGCPHCDGSGMMDLTDEDGNWDTWNCWYCSGDRVGGLTQMERDAGLQERLAMAVNEVTFLERAKASRPAGQWLRIDEQLLERARGHLEALLRQVPEEGTSGR